MRSVRCCVAGGTLLLVAIDHAHDLILASDITSGLLMKWIVRPQGPHDL